MVIRLAMVVLGVGPEDRLDLKIPIDSLEGWEPKAGDYLMVEITPVPKELIDANSPNSRER